MHPLVKCLYPPVVANSCWRPGTCSPLCIAHLPSNTVGNSIRRQESAPGTSQLPLATGNLHTTVHCTSPSGDGSYLSYHLHNRLRYVRQWHHSVNASRFNSNPGHSKDNTGRLVFCNCAAASVLYRLHPHGPIASHAGKNYPKGAIAVCVGR